MAILQDSPQHSLNPLQQYPQSLKGATQTWPTHSTHAEHALPIPPHKIAAILENIKKF
jgi:hypothetical protein